VKSKRKIEGRSVLRASRRTIYIALCLATIYAASMGVISKVTAASGALGSATHRAVQLKSGSIGEKNWRAVLEGGAGTGGYWRPCLRLSVRPHTASILGVRVENRTCSRTRDRPILLSLVNDTEGSTATVLGMIFDWRATHIRVSFGNGGSKLLRPRALDRRRRRTAGVAPVRFSILAFARRICVRRVLAYDSHNKTIYRGRPLACSGSAR